MTNVVPVSALRNAIHGSVRWSAARPVESVLGSRVAEARVFMRPNMTVAMVTGERLYAAAPDPARYILLGINRPVQRGNRVRPYFGPWEMHAFPAQGARWASVISSDASPGDERSADFVLTMSETGLTDGARNFVTPRIHPRILMRQHTSLPLDTVTAMLAARTTFRDTLVDVALNGQLLGAPLGTVASFAELSAESARRFVYSSSIRTLEVDPAGAESGSMGGLLGAINTTDFSQLRVEADGSQVRALHTHAIAHANAYLTWSSAVMRLLLAKSPKHAPATIVPMSGVTAEAALRAGLLAMASGPLEGRAQDLAQLAFYHAKTAWLGRSDVAATFARQLYNYSVLRDPRILESLGGIADPVSV